MLRGPAFAEFPRSTLDQSIPERFEEIVRRHSQRLAVRCAADAWTYLDLNHRANRIAHAILATSTAPQVPIALLLPQGALLISAILGVLKAAGIYLPLDAAAPHAQLRTILRDSQACLILTDASRQPLAASLAPDAGRVLDAGAMSDGAIGEGQDVNPRPSIKPDALAYIYYTSGSTGTPKGVCDTHRNVLHNILRYTNTLHITPEDRLTLLQGPGFSGAVSSMFAALLNGAAVFPFDVPAEGVHRIPAWLREHAITIYHSVPSLFRHVALSGMTFAALRLIRLEGDRALPTDVQLFQRHFPASCILVNGLGATECGLVRQWFASHDTPVPQAVVPIGYPVPDVQVLLLDDAGQPARYGEIVVRGRYLSLGYWNAPHLTAAAFTADPADPTLRTYRTGDLGRFQDDGCLEYLGRKDSVAKIRGVRVVLAEVEAALLDLGSLKEAAVIARADGNADPRLVAYLVPASNPSPTVTAIRRHLSARLPDCMVPSAYVLLPALPLSANRKLDRAALPPLDGQRPALDEPFLEPHSLLEAQLARIWQKLLGVGPVGIRDSFFDLGGDSLLAAQLFAEIQRDLGVTLAPSVMVQHPTIQCIATAIQAGIVPKIIPLMPIQTEGNRRPLFFLHGDYLSGGFFCAALARHLGTQQPFFALPPCGADGSDVPGSYAAMAPRHLEAIRDVQPHGPYCLAGFCNGGLVALEIARLLEAQGDRAQCVIAIASVPDQWPLLWRLSRALAADPDRRYRRFLYLRNALERLRGLPARRRIGWLLGQALKAPGKLKGLLAPTGPSLPSLLSPSEHALREAYHRLDAQYQPSRYPGRVTVLWPVDEALSLAEVRHRWLPVTSQLQIHPIPGTHNTCITQHVHALADALRCAGEASQRGFPADDEIGTDPSPVPTTQSEFP